MKKKILIIIPLILFTLCFASCKSCKKDKRSDFEKLVSYIYESETKIAGYNELTKMFDNDFEVYNKDLDFAISRGNKVKSEVNIKERKLSTSGNSTYDETTSSYTTVDNVKYVELNGTTYQNPYEMPTYYLTFVLSKEFLNDNYTLDVSENNYHLKAQVLDNKASSLFLNKSIGNISNLNIEIVIENNRLKIFTANYISQNGFKVSIETNYYYAEEGLGKAIFYLEGGTCKNSKDRITYVYKFDGTIVDTLIVDPNVLETNENDKILKSGYHIEGWYKNKVTNPDGTVEYLDKWDFENDKMTLDGVTLYAKWEINRLYTYELYYYDQDGKAVLLDSYEVKEGEKFYDLFMDNKTVEGYTSLGYLDEQGNAWDNTFTHPGGNSDLAVKVYLNLIEGEYTLVTNARGFRNALSRGQNIYLLNDIDFDGDEICFDEYSGIIKGNGYKVSNFMIDYDDSRNGLVGPLDDLSGSSDHLYISLFFELTDSVIENITFDNITVDLNTSNNRIKYIIFAPLAIKASNTKLINVKLSGYVTVTKTPEAEMEIITDKLWYNAADDVTVDDATSLDMKNNNK